MVYEFHRVFAQNELILKKIKHELIVISII